VKMLVNGHNEQVNSQASRQTVDNDILHPSGKYNK